MCNENIEDWCKSQIMKEYSIPNDYKVLTKFSPQIVRNISFNFGLEEPYGVTDDDYPRFIFDKQDGDEDCISNRKGEIKDYQIAAKIISIIIKGECKALVLRGDHYYYHKVGNDDKSDKNMISALYFNEQKGHMVVWAPLFEELFMELANDSVPNAKTIHYEIIKEISDKLENLSEEERIKLNINTIIDKRNLNKPWVVNTIDGFPLDARLYHSIIKSIMIIEDIIYSGERQLGRRMLINAYRDLIINKMDIDVWRRKYSHY